MKKILITGIDSFTGKYLSSFLKEAGYDIYGTSLYNTDTKIFQCDITNKERLIEILQDVEPHYIIHLAGISFSAHNNINDFYRVNTIGTINILDALEKLQIQPLKIILASSATVYGKQHQYILDESLCPMPNNHYGLSKYSMESLAKNYFESLNILIVRVFNYTGVKQSNNFLIPKIVGYFKEKKDTIELGNLNVSREFNDIYFVCEVYKKLLECDTKSDVVNLCSNRVINLLDVIQMMNSIASYKITVKENEELIRKNEINVLRGSTKKLFSLIEKVEQRDFNEILREMYEF